MNIPWIIYLGIVSLLFTTLAIKWGSKEFINLLTKIIFAIMAVVSLSLTMTVAGILHK